jgi:creatinine amidohydrolase
MAHALLTGRAIRIGAISRMLKSHWWWDLSASDFAALDMSAMVALLPVGAVEQHGPHLPVRVDAAINAGIVARAVESLAPDAPVLVLPALPIGKSDEHLAYAGTLTLSHETLARVWYEVAASVFRAGCRRIVFFNSHGGQPQVMEIVCRDLRVKLGMFAVGCSWFRITDADDLFSAAEQEFGIHAGEVETSMMLHLHGDLVDMAQAGNFEPVSVAMARSKGLLTPEGAIGYGWQIQDLHPSGACGNAAAADAARGGAIVERAARQLVRLLDEVAKHPLDSIKQTTIYT